MSVERAERVRFPVEPVLGVRVLWQRQNCAPQFALIVVDLEPAAADGVVLEVADGLTVDYEPAEALPRFFAAAACGIEEELGLSEYGVTAATKVVLREARAHAFGSHERAFRIAGHLAACRALERAGLRRC